MGAGAGWPGHMELFNPVSSATTIMRWGPARLAPLIFLVSMTKIKVQDGCINDNLELGPNTEAAIRAMSPITLSPKARKEKGKLCLSTAFLARPLPNNPPSLCFLTPSESY